MVSGLFSAKTVVHLSTAPATASFEHAVAVCTDTPALNTSTTALIAGRVCIISSLISSVNHQYQHCRAGDKRDEGAALCMSGKQHCEGRRGFGHDRFPVATGSPQALRILNRE